MYPVPYSFSYYTPETHPAAFREFLTRATDATLTRMRPRRGPAKAAALVHWHSGRAKVPRAVSAPHRIERRVTSEPRAEISIAAVFSRTCILRSIATC